MGKRSTAYSRVRLWIEQKERCEIFAAVIGALDLSLAISEDFMGFGY